MKSWIRLFALCWILLPSAQLFAAPEFTRISQVRDTYPHLSPDGRRIVFNSDRNTPDPKAAWSDRRHDIWSMRPDGSDAMQHTECRSVCTYGSLSPDGKTLLFRKTDSTTGLNWSMQAGTRNSEIYVANRDGSQPRNLAPHPGFDGWPLWSPDGEWIVFASNRSGPALTGQLWLVRPDGSDLRQLTSGQWGHAQPSWTPDGELLAYRFLETLDAEHGGIARISIKPE